MSTTTLNLFILLGINGATGQNRTGMESPPRDFKSLASTYFTTVANLVPQARLELAHLAVLASKTSVSTNSTIGALYDYTIIVFVFLRLFMVGQVRIELTLNRL